MAARDVCAMDVVVVLRASVRTPELEGSLMHVVGAWSAAVPWEVQLTVLAPGEEPVVWHLDRGVLRGGLEGVSGGGDVVVCPSPRSAVVLVGLAPPEGEAVLVLPRRGLEGLLAASEQVVAPGGEEMAVPDSPAALMSKGGGA